MSKCCRCPAGGHRYLERNVFVAQPDLQFLSTILVLLRPFRVIFPVGGNRQSARGPPVDCTRHTAHGHTVANVLHDLAVLDNALDLLHHQRAHTHCSPGPSATPAHVHPGNLLLTLFADQGIIAVVGVVRVPDTGTATITQGTEVEFYASPVSDHPASPSSPSSPSGRRRLT